MAINNTLSKTMPGLMSGAMNTPFNTKTKPIVYTQAAPARSASSSTPTPMPQAPSTPVKGLLPSGSASISPAATQYNERGQSIGVQHPGMAGFTPLATKQEVSGIPTPTPQGTGFGDLLAGSVNQGNSQYNQSAMKSINNLGNASNTAFSQGTGNAQESYGKTNNYIDQLEKLREAEAQSLANNATNPIPLEFQQGRAQVLQSQYGQRENALAQAAGAESTLYGTGVTQQGNGLSGYGTAAGNALTGQGQVQSALQGAASLAQPSTSAYGQTAYNPVTNSFGASGSGNLDPQTQAQTLAQQVQSGQISYDQAIASMGYAGSAGTTFLNNAITQAGGNPLALQAQGNTQQDVIKTQGTQQASYQSALQQGQNLQAQLADLIKTFGLNPADLNAANLGIQKIAQNTSSPQYQILKNYVNDVASTYAQVLTPPGGSATDTTRGIAASMLDQTAKGSSLITVMNSLDQAAKAKIAGISTTGAQQTSTQTGTVQTKAGAVNTNW